MSSKNQETLSGVAGDLQVAANLMAAARKSLEQAEAQLRGYVEQARAGRHITTAGAAQILRREADQLAEKSSRFHEAARRIEPPSSKGVRITRKTPIE